MKMIALAALSLVGVAAQAQQFQALPHAQTLECYYKIGNGVLNTPAQVQFAVNPEVTTPQIILLSNTPPHSGSTKNGSLRVTVDYKYRQLQIHNFYGPETGMDEVQISRGSFQETSLVYGNSKDGANNVSVQCSVK